MGIRCTSKAVILHDSQVLLIKCHDEANGDYYSLPGGGQKMYETLTDTLIRECLEETGYTVIPLHFAALLEEICDDPVTREKRPDYAHKMHHIFVCRLANVNHTEPSEADDFQVHAEWIDINELPSIRLLPEPLRDNLNQLISCDKPIFLGSEHIPFNHG